MISYRMDIRNADGTHSLIQTGEVGNEGRVHLPVPDPVPEGGTIVIEWKLNGDDSNNES